MSLQLFQRALVVLAACGLSLTLSGCLSLSDLPDSDQITSGQNSNADQPKNEAHQAEVDGEQTTAEPTIKQRTRADFTYDEDSELHPELRRTITISREFFLENIVDKDNINYLEIWGKKPGTVLYLHTYKPGKERSHGYLDSYTDRESTDIKNIIARLAKHGVEDPHVHLVFFTSEGKLHYERRF